MRADCTDIRPRFEDDEREARLATTRNVLAGVARANIGIGPKAEVLRALPDDVLLDLLEIAVPS